jgi:transcriptional regulator with XRE-family HTH domain
MLSISLDTPKERQMRLAARFRELRVLRDLKRETLAAMSGVPSATIRRFELQGEVSLKSLLLLAHALGVAEQFDELFKRPEAMSLDELERRDARLAGPSRKRGRK